MSARTVLVAGAVALTLVAGCKDSTGPGGPSFSGTYALVRVNGVPLPVPVFQEEDEFVACVGVVNAGSLTVLSGNRFRAMLSVTIQCTDKETGQQQTFTETLDSDGTYSRSGNTITFTDEDDDTFTGELSGNTLTVTIQDEDGTFVLVFERQ